MPTDTAADQDSPSIAPGVDFGRLRNVEPKDLGIRFAFGAAVSVVAAIVGQAFSARLGGLFLAFPAILPASLTLLENKETTRRADRNAIGAVLGGTALIAFAVVGETQFTRVNPAVVLIAALAAWLALSFVLYGVLAALRPDDCDRDQD